MIKIYILFFSLIIFYACSSVQSVDRYKKYKTDEKTLSDIRFTSENDTSYLVSDEDVPEELDPSDIPDDTTNFDLTSLIKNLKTQITTNNSTDVSEKEAILMEIVKYYNTPYKFGGNSIDGIDCSGFTQSIYKNTLAINLDRSAREQFRLGEVIEDKNDLEFGDLVFFNTRRRVRPGHVGIYLWDNYFVHANTKRGVTVNSLEENYYSKRYMGARRIKSDGFDEKSFK
jgi:cell wall-associated NlpC family hydrolase